jgi:hypothetical protein
LLWRRQTECLEPRAGFEPATYSLQGTMNWSEYKLYLHKKCSHQYANAQYNIAIKYLDYLDNPSKILSLPTSTRGIILKGLVSLARYVGKYEDFSEDARASKPQGYQYLFSPFSYDVDEKCKCLNCENEGQSN